MNRRNFFSCLLGNLAWLLLPGCSDPHSDSASDAAASGQAGTPSPSCPPSQSEVASVAAYEKENQARVEAARVVESKKARLAQAVARTKDYRQHLQFLNGAAWTKWIGDRTPVFETLRQNAGRSRTGTVPCTICDGRGEASTCVICQNSRQCPDCHGSGTLAGGPCPTCRGDGKCFLCHGSGKMACPFCDDGSIYAKQSAPPKLIPLD